MKISVLAPNISGNSFGRAYILAKVLNRKFDIELIGPVIGEHIWSPLSNEDTIPIKTFTMNGFIRPYKQLRQLARMVDGDVIYCSKPLLTSFGVGLYLKKVFGKPLVLDVDDWEMGFAVDSILKKGLSRLKYLLTSSVIPYKPSSIWNILIMNQFIRFADGLTVSNNFLKDKFGGRIVWHGRDTNFLDPNKYRAEIFRNKYCINPEAKVVMFFGTPRPHKGLFQLIKSMKLLGDSRAVLVIVGIDDSRFSGELKDFGEKELGEKIIFFGQQPFSKVPEFLSIADIIAIPQEKGYSTLGQLPAKIFDAMSMAKPIVATDVSDLSKILEGCGWIVEPGDIGQLSQAIDYILDHPVEAKEKSCQARQKCIQHFSWDSMESELLKIFNNI